MHTPVLNNQLDLGGTCTRFVGLKWVNRTTIVATEASLDLNVFDLKNGIVTDG